MKREDKKGQATMFIIVAMIIVIVAILIFLFRGQIESVFGIGAIQNPSEYMRTCLSDKIASASENVSIQGGSLNPDFYYTYQGDKLAYLCYQEEDYLPCVVQQPLLIRHINSEIKKGISSQVNSCLDSLKTSFEKQGYQVGLKKGDFDVEILPNRVLTTINSELTLTKDTTQVFPRFRVVLTNNIYELASIAESIVSFEATYGDSEVTTYMDLYRDLKVEKLKQTDGTTVYILTNTDTKDVFQFASRGLVWPSGYGNIQE